MLKIIHLSCQKITCINNHILVNKGVNRFLSLRIIDNITMWKATIGANLNSNDADDGDWETDPDFINNVTEQEQRWGSKTVEGSGRTIGAIE